MYATRTLIRLLVLASICALCGASPVSLSAPEQPEFEDDYKGAHHAAHGQHKATAPAAHTLDSKGTSHGADSAETHATTAHTATNTGTARGASGTSHSTSFAGTRTNTALSSGTTRNANTNTTTASVSTSFETIVSTATYRSLSTGAHTTATVTRFSTATQTIAVSVPRRAHSAAAAGFAMDRRTVAFGFAIALLL